MGTYFLVLDTLNQISYRPISGRVELGQVVLISGNVVVSLETEWLR